MKMALSEAKKGSLVDEVPVGAVLVKDGKVIARGHNQKESKNCAVEHSEIVVIRKAAKKLNNWWLEDCDLFVTLEPCPMCVGALINSRVRGIYYGAFDLKSGCCGSVINLTEKGLFNHNIIVEGGIMAKECGAVLTEFFAKKRQLNNTNTPKVQKD